MSQVFFPQCMGMGREREGEGKHELSGVSSYKDTNPTGSGLQAYELI